ncbi:YdeI/OmpD-associated family protein [Patescibacteria group bacterium]|nr:YdeI/OmpD-associated family protein [Patescibacteria group bacterium]
MARLLGGAAHTLPHDLSQSLRKSEQLANLWNGLTELGRNEFICWVTSAKKPETRARRIKRTIEELTEGKRRPCCWPGCPHR